MLGRNTLVPLHNFDFFRFAETKGLTQNLILMKRMWTILCLVCAIAMVSCASIKEKAREHTTQIHYAKTYEEKEAKCKEQREYREDLSTEEKAEYDKECAKVERELTQKDFEQAKNGSK